MDDLVKRRIAGALVLIGVALAVATLLPRPGKIAEEPGVKHVTIDLAARPQPVSPPPPSAEVLPQAVGTHPPAAETPDLGVEIADGSDTAPAGGNHGVAAPPADTRFPTPEPSDAQAPPETAAVEPPVEKSAPPPEPAPVVETPKPQPPPGSFAPKPAPTQAAAPPPAPMSVAATTSPSKPASPSWLIQVGSFADIGNAHLAQDKLKTKGYASIISPAETAKGTLYRVRAGPFASKDQALAAKPVVAGLGFDQASVVEK